MARIAFMAFIAMIAIRAIMVIIMAVRAVPPTAGSCAHRPRMKSEGDCPNMAVKRRAK